MVLRNVYRIKIAYKDNNYLYSSLVELCMYSYFNSPLLSISKCRHSHILGRTYKKIENGKGIADGFTNCIKVFQKISSDLKVNSSKI